MDSDYTLLVLECSPTEQSDIYQVSARWENLAGKASDVIEVYDLPRNLLRSEKKLFVRMKDGLVPDEMRQIGEQLFNVMFPPNSLVRQQYDMLLDEDHSITLILRFLASELSQYPWEAMFDGQRYVIERGLPLVRSIQAFNVHDKPQPVNRLRILYANASPKNLDALLHIGEELYENIQSTLKTPRRGRGVELEKILNEVTRSQLAKQIIERRPHVICLVAHGTPNYLKLHHEKEANEDDPLMVGDLVKMLPKKTPVRVVILVACRTAAYTADTSPELTDFARALLTQPDTGVNAVIAMQTPIDQRRASEFIERLFFHLGQFDPIETAVSQARHVLSQRDRTNRDTFAPVLYMKTRSGVLFRKQIQWVRRIAIGLTILSILLGFLFIGSIVFNLINNTRKQFEADHRVAISNEQRLQTVGQLSRVAVASDKQLISPGETKPALLELLYLDNLVWALGQDGTLRRYSGSQSVAEFNVGAEPNSPIKVGKYLWITSRAEGTLTRIDPTNATDPLQISLASNPAPPFEYGDAIWVQSFVETSLFRIDSTTGESKRFLTGFDTHSAFAGGEYIWLLPKDDDRIQRIQITTLEDVQISLDTNIVDGLYAGQAIWILTEDSSLIQYDPTTLEPLTMIPMPADIEGLRTAAGLIWAFSSDRLSVYSIDPLSAEIVQTYTIDSAVRDMLITETRLWLVTADSSLRAYNLQQKEPLFIHKLTGEPKLWNAFSDGEMLWLPVENELLVLHEEDGTEYRQLAMCREFTKPIYDGVNVWVSCPENGEVRYVPVRMQYFGVERFDGDLYKNIPIKHSAALWFTQEDSGRLLALMDDEPALSEYLGTSLMPLKLDGEYLWTAVPTEGRLLRLHPYIEPPTLLRPFSVLNVTIDEVDDIAGEIQSFDLIEGQIWILHSHPSQLLKDANLSIVNRNTLEIQKYTLETVPTGLAYAGGKVWASASGLYGGSIYVFDPVTGEMIDTLNLPDSEYEKYATWGPVQIGDALYFTAGAPPLNDAGEFVIDLFLNNEHPSMLPLLYEYNLNDDSWGRVIDIVAAPYAPLNADPFLWFLSGYLPNEKNPDSDLLYALNPRSNETIGPFTPCRNMTMPHATDKFVWLGCRLPDNDLWVFDRETGKQIATYSDIGSHPWPPVTIGDYTWVTFRESNNIAAFDADTAALIGVFASGSAPGPPFIYENDVWVINSGEGTMQRLRVEVGK